MVLSASTATAGWHLAYAVKDSHVDRWVKALRDQGWMAWPKVQDLDWLGNLIQDPDLVYSLVQMGVYQWLHVVVNGRLKPQLDIKDVEGQPISPHKYERLLKALAHAPPAGSAVMSTKAKLRELNKFLPRVGELHDLHYHHPTNTLTVFTDGSCKGESVVAGVFFVVGSP